MKLYGHLLFSTIAGALIGFSALTPAFATGVLDLAKAQATVGSWCTHTGINVACDRALQGLAVGGAAINTANPGDLQVDSSNVPRAPQQCKQGPAPTCAYGYQSGPSYDTNACSWNYACIPQSPQPPASVCPNGFATGPTFNTASNSWSYSCNICTNVAQTPVSCSTYAGQYGIPSNATLGSANWTKNSCTNAVTYTGGCTVPAPVQNPAQQLGVAMGSCPNSAQLNIACTDSYSNGLFYYSAPAAAGTPPTPYRQNYQTFQNGTPVVALSFTPAGISWPSMISVFTNVGQSGVFYGIASGMQGNGSAGQGMAFPVNIQCSGYPVTTCQMSGNVVPGYYQSAHYGAWTQTYTYDRTAVPVVSCNPIFGCGFTIPGF